MFKTIDKNSSAEIVEKKSKFIANVFYIEKEEEAEEIIKKIKKENILARHNCFAYSVFTKNGIVNKFSDDGEPSGTAGAPMLKIITSKNLTNILVVVTRYFGGILLGTGGLVKAYTNAFKEALEKAQQINKELGVNAKIVVRYSDLGNLKYYLKQNEIEIENIDYSKNVNVYINLTKEKYDNILEQEKSLNFLILEKQIIKEKYIKIN